MPFHFYLDEYEVFEHAQVNFFPRHRSRAFRIHQHEELKDCARDGLEVAVLLFEVRVLADAAGAKLAWLQSRRSLRRTKPADILEVSDQLRNLDGALGLL